MTELPDWVRVDYPETGVTKPHGHGQALDSGVGHTHIGGDAPHGHVHSKIGPNTYQDKYYLLDTDQVGRPSNVPEDWVRKNCANPDCEQTVWVPDEDEFVPVHSTQCGEIVARLLIGDEPGIAIVIDGSKGNGRD